MGLQNDFMVFFGKELSPVKTPENLKYVRLNLTSINVTLTPLSLFEAQGFSICKMTLTPTSATNGRNKRQSSSSVLITQNNFAVFTNLNSNQEYSLVVSVATEGSSSQPTQGTLQLVLFSGIAKGSLGWTHISSTCIPSVWYAL